MRGDGAGSAPADIRIPVVQGLEERRDGGLRSGADISKRDNSAPTDIRIFVRHGFDESGDGVPGVRAELREGADDAPADVGAFGAQGRGEGVHRSRAEGGQGRGGFPGDIRIGVGQRSDQGADDFFGCGADGAQRFRSPFPHRRIGIPQVPDQAVGIDTRYVSGRV